jgi:hypothetical protein
VTARFAAPGPVAQIARRHRDRVGMRAVQHGGPPDHREQVSAVQDAAADVPARVEVGHDPAAVVAADRRRGGEGSRN